MKKIGLLVLTLLTAALTACSSLMPQQPAPAARLAAEANAGKPVDVSTLQTSGAPIGTDIGSHAMDSIDRSKMSHALDSPLGKSTHWVNGNTGISYTVTPTEKLSMSGNPFCRKYTTTAMRGAKTQTFSGTACVSSSGSWQSIN